MSFKILLRAVQKMTTASLNVLVRLFFLLATVGPLSGCETVSADRSCVYERSGAITQLSVYNIGKPCSFIAYGTPTIASNPENGRATITLKQNVHRVEYTPFAGFDGVDSFYIRASGTSIYSSSVASTYKVRVSVTAPPNQASSIANNPYDLAHGQRVALIIGNGNYSNVPTLRNPASDADLMSETLKSVGFKIIGGSAQKNLDRKGMLAAIEAFSSSARGADVALFYYSGHGVQIEGQNWLVPIDANPTKSRDASLQMVDADLVLRQITSSGTPLNMVILDACRNNPFPSTGARGLSSGLAEMRAPAGTIISYSTQPGNVAQDGDELNSPFTSALAHTITRPGLNIFSVFNNVGRTVKQETNDEQQPWISSSPIDGDFKFVEK